jgi:rod shape-determining protein MreD
VSSSFRAANTARIAASAPAYALEPPSTWRAALGLAAALVVQSTLAPYLTLRGASISFVLLAVVWYATRAGSARGLVFGLIAGACEDALAGGTAPAWTFSTGAIGFVWGRLGGTHFGESRGWLVAGAFLATLVRYGAFVAVLQASGRPLALPGPHFHAILWQSVFNAVVMLGALALAPRLGAAFESRG